MVAAECSCVVVVVAVAVVVADVAVGVSSLKVASGRLAGAAAGRVAKAGTADASA